MSSTSSVTSSAVLGHASFRGLVAVDELVTLCGTNNMSSYRCEANVGNANAMSDTPLEHSDRENYADDEDTADDGNGSSKGDEDVKDLGNTEDDGGEPLLKKRDTIGSRERQAKLKRPVLSRLVIPSSPFLDEAVVTQSSCQSFVTAPSTLASPRSSHYDHTIYDHDTVSLVNGAVSPPPKTPNAAVTKRFCFPVALGYLTTGLISFGKPALRLSPPSPVKLTLLVGGLVQWMVGVVSAVWHKAAGAIR